MTAIRGIETWRDFPGPGIRLVHQHARFHVRVTAPDNLQLDSGHHHFGLVLRGTAELRCESGAFCLRGGMYFGVPGEGRLQAKQPVLVVSQAGHRGLFLIGGPTEETGRLRYINGCSDSLLIPPTLKGDACLNLLCIPPGVDQTAHTHPSFRLGVVIDGAGVCRTEDGDQPLGAGTVFLIRRDSVHSFHTVERGLRIVAFHPDSDFGPTHEDHPMLNRTVVQGVPISGPPARSSRDARS